jgi:DNA-binding transcriptional regulator YhcF (GntR family)
MNIQIDSHSDVPIRRQLTEQIVYLIVTDSLKGGQHLPSVRELARRLKIHHNTVSESYQDLVRRKWLQRQRGRRLVVAARESITPPGSAQTLDDLINGTIRMARLLGYSLQKLRERVRERLLTEAPDHILVVEQNVGLRDLMCEELHTALKWPVEGCSREDLNANPGLAIGALAVAGQYAAEQVADVFPKDRPVLSVSYSSAEQHVDRIRSLRESSTVAVVSSSEVFLTVARSILAPAIGRRHDLLEVLLSRDDPKMGSAADIVFCDSIARRVIRSPKAIHYQLIASESLKYVLTAVNSYAGDPRS